MKSVYEFMQKHAPGKSLKILEEIMTKVEKDELRLLEESELEQLRILNVLSTIKPALGLEIHSLSEIPARSHIETQEEYTRKIFGEGVEATSLWQFIERGDPKFWKKGLESLFAERSSSFLPNAAADLMMDRYPQLEGFIIGESTYPQLFVASIPSSIAAGMYNYIMHLLTGKSVVEPEAYLEVVTTCIPVGVRGNNWIILCD